MILLFFDNYQRTSERTCAKPKFPINNLAYCARPVRRVLWLIGLWPIHIKIYVSVVTNMYSRVAHYSSVIEKSMTKGAGYAAKLGVRVKLCLDRKWSVHASGLKYNTIIIIYLCTSHIGLNYRKRNAIPKKKNEINTNLRIFSMIVLDCKNLK